MLDRFRRRLGSTPPRRILIGLSGGSDSVALLALALDWRTAHDPKVEIATAHLDHGLRGERAGEDAEFCRTLAASVGVSHYESAVDVARRAREERCSLETAGRRARLEFFSRVAVEHSFPAVLTAHHRDDQVETILARILRGSGPRGRSGIPHRRPLAPGSVVSLLRPCLDLTRAELAKYREARGLDHREDETNLRNDAERNRLRNQLLPLLRSEVDPDIDDKILAVGRTSCQIVSAQQASLRALLSQLGEGAVIVSGPHVSLAPAACRALADQDGLCSAILQAIWNGELAEELPSPPQSRARGRRLALPAWGGELRRSHHREWQRFLAGNGRGTLVELPGAITLERCGGWVHLISGGDQEDRNPPSECSPEVALSARSEWKSAVFSLGGDAMRNAGGAERIESGRIPAGVRAFIRGARPDDRIALEGSHRRVGELLRGLGIPARWRMHYPVIALAEPDLRRPADRAPLLWVPGVRDADLAPSASASTEVSLSLAPEGEHDPLHHFLTIATVAIP